MSKDSGKGTGKTSDSSPAIIPGKGVDPKQVQAGIERRSVPEPPTPTPPRGGWFGGKR